MQLLLRVSGVSQDFDWHAIAPRKWHPDYWTIGWTVCEEGPIFTKPTSTQVVLPRIKRLLAARAQQAGQVTRLRTGRLDPQPTRTYPQRFLEPGGAP